CRSASAPSARMSARRPNRCTTTMPATGPATRARASAAAAGSRLSVRGSMSANTGRAPSLALERGVAKKLEGGVKPRAPGPTPRAASPSARASVPEFTPTACGTPQYAAIASSKPATRAPSTSCWLSSTPDTAARTSAPTSASWARRSRNGTFTETSGGSGLAGGCLLLAGHGTGVDHSPGASGGLLDASQPPRYPALLAAWPRKPGGGGWFRGLPRDPPRSAAGRSAAHLPAPDDDAGLRRGRYHARRVLRRAPLHGPLGARAQPRAAGVPGRRGRRLLPPPRDRPVRHHPGIPRQPLEQACRPGRQHHHAAGGEDPPPEPRAPHRAQGEGGDPLAAPREQAQQGRHPLPLHEPDLLRRGGVRRAGRRAHVLRRRRGGDRKSR